MLLHDVVVKSWISK